MHSNPVKVRAKGDIAHNQACGGTKRWKPEGAAVSVVAVAPTESVEVLENSDKLAVVDSASLIQRHACKECGVTCPVRSSANIPSWGLSFAHPELFQEGGWARIASRPA